jgi:hypothetical protein
MTDQRTPAERPAYLAFLPAFLFRPEVRKLAYILKAWDARAAAELLLSLTVSVSVPGARARTCRFQVR